VRDLLFDLQLFAGTDDEDTGADSQTSDTGQETNGEDTTDGPDNPDKSFSQAELDRILKNRLERERKKWQEEAEERERKAKMDETERLKSEKEEAEKKAEQLEEAANKRLIAAEAKLKASELGITDPNAAVKLADFADVEVSEDGNVTGVEDALKLAVEQYPILKQAAQNTTPGAGRGSNPGRSTSTKNPWAKETWNLTEQGRLLRDDSDLAKRLKAEAGK